jgi:hypothetical protein
MRALRVMTLLILALLLPIVSGAADETVGLLPQSACGGWQIEGKPVFYDRDTLSDRINGEAELYFPYGFDRMAAARFAPAGSTGAGMDVEVYRMGSLLDAFGMYANYRQKEGTTLGIGADSNLSGSQFFLYQDRYFVHIQTTGTATGGSNPLAACAKVVAALLPGTGGKPPELAAFDRPELVKGTERFLPQSLLGYDFLNRGLMADAIVNGTTLQLFRLLGTTPASATLAYEAYRSQLAKPKIVFDQKRAALLLEGVDSLYGPVMILKSGDCLAGALKFGDAKGVRALLESICK